MERRAAEIRMKARPERGKQDKRIVRGQPAEQPHFAESALAGAAVIGREEPCAFDAQEAGCLPFDGVGEARRLPVGEDSDAGLGAARSAEEVFRRGIRPESGRSGDGGTHAGVPRVVGARGKRRTDADDRRGGRAFVQSVMSGENEHVRSREIGVGSVKHNA